MVCEYDTTAGSGAVTKVTRAESAVELRGAAPDALYFVFI
jgi:hypothetical protein